MEVGGVIYLSINSNTIKQKYFVTCQCTNFKIQVKQKLKHSCRIIIMNVIIMMLDYDL